MVIDLIQYMYPTPNRITARSVRAMFKALGLGPDAVTVWQDFNKVFVKKRSFLPDGEYKLFCRVIRRLGARYRKDYQVFVIRV